MNVSAIIVTRGDVDLRPVLDSLPQKWEKIVWSNEGGWCSRWLGGGFYVKLADATDVSVYGRYAAIEYASHDVIYVQDDDAIVSDPQELVGAWDEMETLARIEQTPDSETAFLVANMPQEFRHDGYTDSCLVGFGACFYRDAPARAFDRFWKRGGTLLEQMAVHMQMPLVGSDLDPSPASRPMVVPPPVFFQRTCDVVFTCLTPRVLVDVPKVNREFAEDEGRMYRQPGHVEERQRMLELTRQVRDA